MRTAVEELEACLANINTQEDRIQAWTFWDAERARWEASEHDRHPKMPLTGMVVGIKDIFDVADMPTGCGSVKWKNAIARNDSRLVRNLREAGAVILGKTVTTAYAYLDPSKTLNPWKLDRTPGGSSAGSAAAVAAGMCSVAIGSQTGGSTIRPASYCGVASLKPTHGAISTQGALALAPSLDHVGIMANTVRDLAKVFQVVAGPDAEAGFGEANHHAIPDCLHLIESNQSAPVRPIQRLTGLFEERATPEMLKHYTLAIAKLESELAPLERVVPPVGFQHIHTHHITLMSSECASVHFERFQRDPGDYPPKISELIQMGLQRSGPALSEALKQQVELTQVVERILKTAGVFVTPATPDFAPTRETTGNPSFNSPWSFLGFPVVSVPAGWSEDGLPFALQFIGPPHSEAEVLAVAAWAESVLQFERRAVPC